MPLLLFPSELFVKETMWPQAALKPNETNCELWIWAIQIQFHWLKQCVWKYTFFEAARPPVLFVKKYIILLTGHWVEHHSNSFKPFGPYSSWRSLHKSSEHGEKDQLQCEKMVRSLKMSKRHLPVLTQNPQPAYSISSLVEEFKCTKTGLETTLPESGDTSILAVGTSLTTGQK